MLILALFVMVFFAFVMASMVGNVQAALNPMLGADVWVTEGHFQMFSQAATLVSSFWVYILAVAIIGLGLWAWIYVQRRSY